MIIGFTGRMAAGKGFITEHLQSRGFHRFSLSDEVREEAKKREIPFEREKLQFLGNELRMKYGDGVLAKRTLQKLENLEGDFVIEGIRNPAEIKELKKHGEFFLIALDAPRKLRYQRFVSKKRENIDPMTWEEFLIVDDRDFGKGQDKSGQNTGKCMELADFSLFNDSDEGSFSEKINEILEQITLRLGEEQS